MASNKNKSAAGTLAVVQGILVAAAGIGALIGTPSRAQTPSVSAVVVKATNGCFASAVRFTGLVVPRVEAIVNFNADGYQISEILVGEGDVVTAGQVLVKLTKLANASGGSTGGQGQSQSQSGASGGQPQSGAGANSQQPATMSLTAPVAGLVSKSTAKVGAVAAPVPLPPPMGPEPLFRIIAGNVLEVEADVPSIDLVNVKNGELARMLLDNGHDGAGKVRIVMPEIDSKTQLGKVRLTLDRDPTIRAGMFARGTIDASHSCGVSIPRAAVLYQTQGASVQIVQNSTIESRRVRLGLLSDIDIEVLDGITTGELVIANAGASLHEGDKVTPVFANEAGHRGGQ